MRAYGLFGLLGQLACVFALLALVLAWRGKRGPGRTDQILLSVAIVAGTTHYFLPRPLSARADVAAAVISFLLMGALLWRLARGPRDGGA